MENKIPSSERIQWQISLRLFWLGLALAYFSFGATVVQSKVRLAVIKQISVLAEPPSVRIELDRSVPFRSVRLGSREVMIAFKGASFSEKIKKQGEGGESIFNYTLARQPNDVVTLRVTTDRDIGDIQTGWDQSVNTLTVGLLSEKSDMPVSRKEAKRESKTPKALSNTPRKSAKTDTDDAIPPAVPQKAIEKPIAPEPQAVTAPNVSQAASSSIPSAEPKVSALLESTSMLQLSPSSTERMRGSEDDLLIRMDGVSCPDQPKFQEALLQCGKTNWREAFQLLNVDLQSNPKNSCMEKEFYLRAYAYYKLNQQGNEGLYLEALDYFQEATSYFPNSIYAPYALTSVGKIYKALNNYAEAKGYFKIILEKYKDYPGRPEVMFHLGQIYSLENNIRMSIPMFKEILTNFPNSHFAVEVKLELGKALYTYNQYTQALEMLDDVMVKDPRKAFALEDLLLVMGNSYYQLGKFREARDALIRAFNLFPNADANPVSLTRIGDILRDTGQPEKAKKIYQIVMDRFPGTDGGAISAMRKAALLEERTEKENIYRIVLAQYPNHPMAILAVVKLSDLQYRAGEFRDSIETLRPLLITGPKDLRAEISYIMQESFKGLLSEMTKADAYLEMIAISQKEASLLRRFGQPEIFRMLGNAHLKGHLYSESVKFFTKADESFGMNAPAELYFEYGMALQESGDAQLALTKLQEYIQKAPQGEHAASACCRIARLLIDQKDGNGALGALKEAATVSNAASEKMDILRLTAEAHSLLGDFKTAAHELNELVDLLKSAPEKVTDLLFDAYRQLGDAYMKMNSNADAANAFELALKYSGKTPADAVIVQLGEAYRNVGQNELAIKNYNQVLASDDEFWKSVAKERLQRMELEHKMKTDSAKR